MNLLYGSVFGLSAETAGQRRADYHRGLVEGGHSPEGKSSGCLTMVYVADSMERARDEFRDPVRGYYETISRYVAPKAGKKAVESYEMYTTFRDVAAKMSWEPSSSMASQEPMSKSGMDPPACDCCVVHQDVHLPHL